MLRHKVQRNGIARSGTVVKSTAGKLIGTGNGIIARQHNLIYPHARQVVDMRQEAKVGCLVLQHKAVGPVIVIVQHSCCRAAVARGSDVVAVVGTGLRLLAQDGHALAGIVNSIGRCVQVGAVEDELRSRLVSCQLARAALIAHVKADAVVLSPKERHIVLSLAGESAAERRAMGADIGVGVLCHQSGLGGLYGHAALEHHAPAVGHHQTVNL